jgi:hypothetical protein
MFLFFAIYKQVVIPAYKPCLVHRRVLWYVILVIQMGTGYLDT